MQCDIVLCVVEDVMACKVVAVQPVELRAVHDSRCSVEVLLTTTRLCCYDGLPYLLIISTYSPHIYYYIHINV